MCPKAASTTLSAFRIVQEALTNVVKHAAPGLPGNDRLPEDELSLEITDDGGPRCSPAPAR